MFQSPTASQGQAENTTVAQEYAPGASRGQERAEALKPGRQTGCDLHGRGRIRASIRSRNYTRKRRPCLVLQPVHTLAVGQPPAEQVSLIWAPAHQGLRGPEISLSGIPALSQQQPQARNPYTDR
ncbi:hypothetical protein HPB50_023670 [Hyalomma asiaticum]|uniref:Uncharacterized protein n=1 Tax=Hyalomma asiaticum TaxID=266040 RepID=A0ACB7T6T7_HYAAI|nr:hypothetical protein HPB50_023670 [Hyalomma asiaticum]